MTSLLWAWRRLHALNKCRRFDDCDRADVWAIDMGYCLDRYSIEHDGEVVVCRP